MTQTLSKPMINLRGFQILLAAVFALWACAAQAVTLNFDEYINGANLGSTTVATLEANDVANGIEITLENTGPVGLFIGRLSMGFEGASSTLSLATYPDLRGLSTTPYTTAGTTYNVSALFWGMTGNVYALTTGHSVTFTILGATVSSLFTSDLPVINLLDGNGGSSRYAASLAEAPLPAAGLMLLAALGLLGVARRRQA